MFCHAERSRGISLPSRGISRQARNDKVLMISVGGGFETLTLALSQREREQKPP